MGWNLLAAGSNNPVDDIVIGRGAEIEHEEVLPLDSKPGRYRPPDVLLGFLDGL